MAQTAHQDIREKLVRNLLQRLQDRLYLVDLHSRTCTEYAPDDFTPMRVQEYDAWLVSLGRRMYKPDAANFFPQMELETILAALQGAVSCYTVYFRLHEHAHIREYALRACYIDESRAVLAFVQQEMPENHPRPLEMSDELAHMTERFRFMIEHMAEDFIEVQVSTGKCRMFHRDNGMESFSSLKEQISWWAEHLIVPEERAAYIEEFDLKNLVHTLHSQNGYHNTIYMAQRGNCRLYLSITCILHREKFGAQEEYIFAYAQDVTSLKEQEIRNKRLVDISQQLLNLSQTEAVTGLYNRAAGEKFIEEHLVRHPHGDAGTMLLIDIDYFKRFNDQYGHQTGDFVLRFLGKSMQDVFRSDDILCRWGGDEFVVFMRDVCQKKSVESRIERLRARMRQCRKGPLPQGVTLSVGGATARDGATLKSLFAQCDKSLYLVKRQGRDGFFIDASQHRSVVSDCMEHL